MHFAQALGLDRERQRRIAFQALAVLRIGLADGVQLGRRKRQRQRVVKTYACGQGLTGLDPLALEHPLQNPHRLEKLEAMRLGQQLQRYARIDSPLRGKHRTSSSPVSLEMSTSRIKLLAWT